VVGSAAQKQTAGSDANYLLFIYIVKSISAVRVTVPELASCGPLTQFAHDDHLHPGILGDRQLEFVQQGIDVAVQRGDVRLNAGN